MLSGPVIGQQEVLVFAGEAELEVTQRPPRAEERPASHQQRHQVGGDQAAFVLGVQERLQETAFTSEGGDATSPATNA